MGRNPTHRWTRAAGACFATNWCGEGCFEFAPPRQLRRSTACDYFDELLSTTLLKLGLLTAAAISPVVAQERLCPTVRVECVSKDCCRSPLRLMARVGNARSKRLSYKWTVSYGRIAKGQGTRAITVIWKPYDAVTATLEISGPDAECPRVASITQICEPPVPIRLFDEYLIVPGTSDKSHLDRFATQLNNEPTARGYIVVYGERTPGDDAKAYLAANGNIEGDRLVVVARTRRIKKVTIKLYVVPAGAIPPLR